MMKTCKRCQRKLPTWEFSRHPATKDRLQQNCKACAVAAMRDWQRRNAEKCRASARKFRQQNPEKVRAHDQVAKAIESGQIVRKPCEMCGALKTHAHHDDYTKPMEVRWLCPKHHRFVHVVKSKGLNNFRRVTL
jgi:hypothetical protein